MLYNLIPWSWWQVYLILWTFLKFFSAFFKMFKQYSCNLKEKKLKKCFLLIYDSKKIRCLFLTIFYLSPVAAKINFLTKNLFYPICFHIIFKVIKFQIFYFWKNIIQWKILQGINNLSIISLTQFLLYFVFFSST